MEYLDHVDSDSDSATSYHDGEDEFIVETDTENSSEGTQILRSNISTSKEAQKWIDQFKSKGGFDFIKGEKKKVQKLIYHEYWKCNLSKKNKLSNSKRNLSCPLTVDIKIKKVNKGTIKNDKKFLKRQVPLAAVITIKNKHNHPLINHEALQYRRPTKETKQRYWKKFAQGVTPAAAKRLFEMQLLLEEEGEVKKADASINPTDRQLYHMYDKWRESKYGKDWMDDPMEHLIKSIPGYKEKGTDIFFDNRDVENWALIVVTPIMKRAHYTRAAGEIIFMDSTSNCESSQTSITPILAATAAGAIPIAILVHKNQSTKCYENGLRLLKTHFPRCFGGKEAPEVFMTDDSTAEKGALRNVWPDTPQLLCHFHVAQKEWKWLLDGKNRIPLGFRQKLMYEFKKIMYSVCAEDLEEAKLRMKELCVDFPRYDDRIEELLEKKEEWVKLFRMDMIYRSHNTNNLAEACIRILKDIILTRTKAYNVPSLVDFIVNVWELYFQDRILDFAYGQRAKPHLKYKNLCERMPESFASKIVHVGGSTYQVPSATEKDLMYEVDTAIGWCACMSGKTGAFCKHQALIYSHLGVGDFPNAPPIDCKGRYLLGRLALGDKCPNFEFFIGLKEKVTEELRLAVDSEVQRIKYLEEGGEVDMNFRPRHSAIPQEEGPTENEINVETDNSHQEQSATDQRSVYDEIDVSAPMLSEELSRIHKLIEKSETPRVYANHLTRLAKRLKQVKNPSQAVSMMVILSRAAHRYKKKGGKIQVNDTSRRREGVTRGSKRVAAGRPPKAAAGRVEKRRPHKLSLAIQNNVASVQSHGVRTI